MNLILRVEIFSLYTFLQFNNCAHEVVALVVTCKDYCRWLFHHFHFTQIIIIIIISKSLLTSQGKQYKKPLRILFLFLLDTCRFT